MKSLPPCPDRFHRVGRQGVERAFPDTGVERPALDDRRSKAAQRLRALTGFSVPLRRRLAERARTSCQFKLE